MQLSPLFPFISILLISTFNYALLWRFNDAEEDPSRTENILLILRCRSSVELGRYHRCIDISWYFCDDTVPWYWLIVSKPWYLHNELLIYIKQKRLIFTEFGLIRGRQFVIYSYVSRKEGIDISCKLSSQCAWYGRVYFLGKIRKIFQIIICWIEVPNTLTQYSYICFNAFLLSRKYTYIIWPPKIFLLCNKTGVYRDLYFFSYFCSNNIDCGFSLEPPRQVPTIFVLSRNMKKYEKFLSKMFWWWNFQYIWTDLFS